MVIHNQEINQGGIQNVLLLHLCGWLPVLVPRDVPLRAWPRGAEARQAHL